MQAPDFCLPDENGTEHCLSDYREHYVLVYFYPKDDTPGCTKEAQAIREAYRSYKEHSIVVFGISPDSIESHSQFKEKYNLPFTLLSDPDKKVIELYGAKGLIATKRISYLINPDGIIEKIYEKVIPEKHAEEVIRDVERLEKQ